MEQFDFFEIIGNILETVASDMPQEVKDRIISSLETIDEAYVLVQWPESQELMEESWFDKEAILDVKGTFGSSAYFVPLRYML